MYPILKKVHSKVDEVLFLQEHLLTDVAGAGPLMATRAKGEFAGKALFLDPVYDWYLGTDSEGILILVPVTRSPKTK